VKHAYNQIMLLQNMNTIYHMKALTYVKKHQVITRKNHHA